MAARRVIVAAWLALLSPAPAEEPAESRARAHFEAAVRAQQGGRLEEALRELRAAWELAPYAGIRFRIAECEEGLGQTAEAIADYERYLTEAPRSSKRELVEARIHRLRGEATAPSPPPPEQAEREQARRHFELGGAFYAQGDYPHALEEFREAYRTAPSGALDFNIARCLDRMGRAQEAIAGYERYLDSEPFSADAGQVRLRVAELKQRLAPPAPPAPVVVAAAPPPPPPKSRYLPAIIVGSGALALAVTGLGLRLSVTDADYDRLAMTCPRPCSESQYGPYRDREYAGVALLGIAGALAVADVVLFVVAARKRR
jgi:tetratricopeptide (TPR) repeat protein